MIIYLAGGIPKGDIEAQSFDDWRFRYIEVLKPVFNAEFITPLAGEVDENDELLVVGKDSSSIKKSDLVIVNAQDRMGAGTAMELVIAKYLSKPVITVLPKDSYHRRSNLRFGGTLLEDWIHPFVKNFSDYIVESIEEIASIKDRVFTGPIKDITIIDQAIEHREKLL